MRDIGGYRSAYGPWVVRGRLFRGDALCQLSGADSDAIRELGLRTVIDFRTPGEILINGSDRLPGGLAAVNMPVTGGDLSAFFEIIASGNHELQRYELGDGRGATLMANIYRDFVADPRQRETFGAALRLLCVPGRLPALYHCSGGKDRSGWMTAIILTILGVPREVVLRDYLVSNDLHSTTYHKIRSDLIRTGIIRDPELLRPVLEQSPTYLSVAYDETERRFGSFGAFVAYGLGVSEADTDELRRAMISGGVPGLAGASGPRRAA